MAEALADRLAEAFAEKLHELVRRELWGYAPDENMSVDDMLKVKYQVSRRHTERHIHSCLTVTRHHVHTQDLCGTVPVCHGLGKEHTIELLPLCRHDCRERQPGRQHMLLMCARLASKPSL